MYVRTSFVVLAALFVFLELDEQVPVKRAVLWIPVLLISVLVHELAHAATIGALGHGPSRIELGGWGGQTMNQRRAPAWQEIVISLAGPLSSLILGGICILVFMRVDAIRESLTLLSFFKLMVQANIAWGIFNLLPIFPLDGGQVLLYGLVHFVSRATAFIASTWISLALALTLGLVALLGFQLYFVAIVAASLLMQNWANWRAWQQMMQASRERDAARDAASIETTGGNGEQQ